MARWEQDSRGTRLVVTLLVATFLVTLFLATQGIAAAFTQYRDLRRDHLTRGNYEFSIRPLSVQARRLLQAKDADGAQQVMELAIKVGLDGLMARLTLVDVALAQGQKDAALAHLAKS